MATEAEREAAALRVLASLLDPRDRPGNLTKGPALEADRAAGHAFRKGDYSRALTWLESARQLDPDLPEIAEHFQRVRAAERAAAAKVAKARDLGEVADSFGERTAAYLALRDSNRGEPTRPCDAPKGEAHCGELGHQYPAGARCDEHRPRQAEPEPGRPWEPAENSLATYVPAQKEYRDLSHGHPEHECILPDTEPGQ
jgi:hypothetical protein